MKTNFEKYEGFIFDLDGTIYRGKKIIDGSNAAINHIQSLGKKVIFVSNKTTGTSFDYYDFLTKNNFNIRQNQIVNATEVVKNYISQNHSGENFYAIGEESFIKEIASCGVNYSKNPNEINFVIITLDRTFNFEKLEIAAKAIVNGASFYAANIDATCPVDGGEIWDAGATILALEKRTHRKLGKHFGKPSKYVVLEIGKRLNIDLKKCLIIGDRLETDIAMGNNFGIDTALVETGVNNFANGNVNIKPTYSIHSVMDLLS